MPSWFAALLAAALVSPPAARIPLQDSASARRLLALVEAINAGDSASILRFGVGHYDSTALAESGGQARLLTRWLEIRETIGPIAIDTVISGSATVTEAWARGTISGAWLSFRLMADSVAPHRVLRIGLGRGLRPGHALSRVPETRPEALGSAIERYMDRLAQADLFSGVVLVKSARGVVFQRSYGQADRRTGRGMGLETPFDIASVGKMLTAVAVGRLLEDGRLTLDDSTGRHLPELPPALRRLTLAQLLEHSSGLGELGPGLDSAMGSARSVTEMLRQLGDTTLAFAPGTDFRYSNRGYVILGAVVERAGGMRYDEYLAREIFPRAGMSRTSLGPPPAERAHRYTRYPTLRSGYTPGGRVEFDPADDLAPGPHGGAYSTAADLGRLADALLTGRIISPGTLRLLTAPRNGHPWARGFQPGRTGFGHGGGTPGMNSLIWIFPQSGYSIVVLSNFDNGANLAGAFLQDLIETSWQL